MNQRVIANRAIRVLRRVIKRARIFSDRLPLLLALAAFLLPKGTVADAGSFLETIGVSTAVGTVLGASTLPFYEQPGEHTMNMVYGASAGAVVGLGIWIYGLLTSDHDMNHSQEQLFKRRLNQRMFSFRSLPTYVWTPMVSLNL